MLAYRHAFHAGNHADVLKHLVLVQLIRHLGLKDKGFRIVDTHAGAGLYELDSVQALKKGEFLQGIGRLWDSPQPPPLVADYLHQIRAHNPDGNLRRYPGSPQLARQLQRPQDQLRLFELHPAEQQALQQMVGGMSGIELRQADGFAALKSQLPPPTRRALVLVDPSYEGHADYTRVLDALGDAQEVDNVIVIGLTHKSGLTCKKPLHYISNQGRMLANIVVGVNKSLELNKKTEYVLVVSSDIPAIKSDMVDWLVQTTMQTRDDIYYGVCPREVMEGRFPTSKRTYTKLKDMEVCGADMNVIHVSMATEHLDTWEKLIGNCKSPLASAAVIGFDTFF